MFRFVLTTFYIRDNFFAREYFLMKDSTVILLIFSNRVEKKILQNIIPIFGVLVINS